MGSDSVGHASAEERREEMSYRYPDVIRVMAGLCASSKVIVADPDTLAQTALDYVLAAERVCGIGGGV